MKIAVFVLVAALICVALAADSAPRMRRAVSPLSKAKLSPAALADHRVPPPTTLWFDQQIDHFNFANAGTWKQRYLILGT